MKKQILSLALFSLFGTISAQANFIIADASLANVTGTTQTYWIDQDNLDSRNFTMTNTSSNSINVKVRRTIIQLNTPTAYTYFCNCITCFGTGTNLSSVFTLAPGVPCVLTPDYFPDSTGGTGIVRYAILDQTTAADSVTLDIIYNPTPAGINSFVFSKSSRSTVFPNPATSFFSINYHLDNSNVQDGKLMLYNVIGDRVKEIAIVEMDGTMCVDVSTLEPGIYFCALETNGKIITTQRLVVTH